jgi:hypothetical protein
VGLKLATTYMNEGVRLEVAKHHGDVPQCYCHSVCEGAESVTLQILMIMTQDMTPAVRACRRLCRASSAVCVPLLPEMLYARLRGELVLLSRRGGMSGRVRSLCQLVSGRWVRTDGRTSSCATLYVFKFPSSSSRPSSSTAIHTGRGGHNLAA